jgi:hypothetical protein
MPTDDELLCLRWGAIRDFSEFPTWLGLSLYRTRTLAWVAARFGDDVARLYARTPDDDFECSCLTLARWCLARARTIGQLALIKSSARNVADARVRWLIDRRIKEFTETSPRVA